MNELLAQDTALFRYLNGHAVSPFIDPVMIFFSAVWPWLLGVGVALAILIWKRRWDWWRPALLMAMTIGITDAISAFILKPSFGRPRPCRALEDINVLMGCAGQFGFPSNHSANAAATVVSLILLAGWRPWTATLLGMAVLVAYSRVYVGAHYPLDIIAGFLLGTIVAIALNRALGKRLRPRPGRIASSS